MSSERETSFHVPLTKTGAINCYQPGVSHFENISVRYAAETPQIKEQRLVTGHIQSCQVALDISGSPAEFQ